MKAAYVIAWVYIGAFVFFSGFWFGAWLWWRELQRWRATMVMRFLPGLDECLFCGARGPTEGVLCCDDGVDCGVWVKPIGAPFQWRIRCLPVRRGVAEVSRG